MILSFRAFKSSVKIHRHAAIQVVLTEDKPFSTRCDNRQYDSIYGFVIKPQVAHACECTDSTAVVHNIESYSLYGQTLLNQFKTDQNVIVFYSQQQIDDFFKLALGKCSTDYLINAATANHHITDARINQVLRFIDTSYQSNRCAVEQLAQMVHLSPSRLASLFKSQVGCSISKYVLWTRIRSAIYLILKKDHTSFTEIAAASGFYDSSQMNKYMDQMLGVSPSQLKKKSDLIQFLQYGQC